MPLLIPAALNATATLGFLALQREQWHKTRTGVLDALPDLLPIREITDFQGLAKGSILVVARQNGLTSLGISMGQAFLNPNNEWANATHAAIISNINDLSSLGALEIPNSDTPLSDNPYRIDDLPHGEDWMIFNPALLLQKPENETFLKHVLAIGKTFVSSSCRIQPFGAPYHFSGLATLPLRTSDRFEAGDWIHLFDRLLDYRILLTDEAYAPQNTQYFCSEFVWECVQLARLVQAHPDIYKQIEEIRKAIDVLSQGERREALEALYQEFQDKLLESADDPLFSFPSRSATPAKLIEFARMNNLSVSRISNRNGTASQWSLRGIAARWAGNRLFKEGVSCALEKPVEEILKDLEKKIHAGETIAKDDSGVQCLIEHLSVQTTYSKETLECMIWECLLDPPEKKAECPQDCLEKTLTWREKISLFITSIAIDRTLNRLIATGQLERFLDQAIVERQLPEELTVAGLTDQLFASESLGFYGAFTSPGKVMSSAENFMIRQYVRYFLSDADLYKHFPLGLLGSKNIFEMIGWDYTPPSKKLADFTQAYLQKKLTAATSVLP